MTLVERGQHLSFMKFTGSESATDKTYHNSERMKESKLINSSLMTLKECMRGRSMVLQAKNHVHIPYRTSKLTLVLRDCFELAVRRPVKSAIIACVSPLETACYHSTNTLRYVWNCSTFVYLFMCTILLVVLSAHWPPLWICLALYSYAADIRIAPTQVVLEPDIRDPSTWDREKCFRFLNRAGKGRATPTDILPEGSGKILVRIPEHDFVSRALASGRMSDVQAKELYITLWEMVADARSRFKHIQKNVTAPPGIDKWAEEFIDRVREEESAVDHFKPKVPLEWALLFVKKQITADCARDVYIIVLNRFYNPNLHHNWQIPHNLTKLNDLFVWLWIWLLVSLCWVSRADLRLDAITWGIVLTWMRLIVWFLGHDIIFHLSR